VPAACGVISSACLQGLHDRARPALDRPFWKFHGGESSALSSKHSPHPVSHHEVFLSHQAVGESLSVEHDKELPLTASVTNHPIQWFLLLFVLRAMFCVLVLFVSEIVRALVLLSSLKPVNTYFDT